MQLSLRFPKNISEVAIHRAVHYSRHRLYRWRNLDSIYFPFFEKVVDIRIFDELWYENNLSSEIRIASSSS